MWPQAMAKVEPCPVLALERALTDATQEVVDLGRYHCRPEKFLRFGLDPSALSDAAKNSSQPCSERVVRRLLRLSNAGMKSKALLGKY